MFTTQYKDIKENYVQHDDKSVVVDTPYPLDTQSILQRYVKGEPIECVSNTPRVPLQSTFFNSWKVRDKLALTEEIWKTKQFIKNTRNELDDELKKQQKLVESTQTAANMQDLGNASQSAN